MNNLITAFFTHKLFSLCNSPNNGRNSSRPRLKRRYVFILYDKYEPYVGVICAVERIPKYPLEYVGRKLPKTSLSIGVIYLNIRFFSCSIFRSTKAPIIIRYVLLRLIVTIMLEMYGLSIMFFFVCRLKLYSHTERNCFFYRRFGNKTLIGN